MIIIKIFKKLEGKDKIGELKTKIAIYKRE